MPGRRGWSALLASVVLGFGLALSGSAPAQATALSLSQCTTTYGAILAVDFRPWGGPVLRACGSTPTTGYTLLNQGGWATTGTGHDGPAFICRIGYSGFNGGAGYPTEAQENCAHTPTGALWSYFHADPGASGWTLSQDGAVGYSPKPGSVDAWIYGSTASTPSFTPDSVRAHNASAPPTTGGTGGSGTGGSGTGGSGGSGSSGGGSTGGGSTAGSARGATSNAGGAQAGTSGQTGGTSAPGRGAGATASTGHTAKPETTMAHGKALIAGSPTSSSSATRSGIPGQLLDAAPVAKVTDRHRSAFPAIAGTVLILALVVAGALTGWRRRSRTG
jgi:uncharacterized membrane protein YgcG